MSPAAQLLDQAVCALGPGMRLALASDAWTYADERSPLCVPGGKKFVLVAIARPDAACVVSIPAHLYDGIKVMEIAGLGDVFGERADEPPDIEKLRREKHELQTRPVRRNSARAARA